MGTRVSSSTVATSKGQRDTPTGIWTQRLGNLGRGRTTGRYGMHGCIMGGWDGQGQREVRHPKEDIGSAFCTQEQVGDLDL